MDFDPQKLFTRMNSCYIYVMYRELLLITGLRGTERSCFCTVGIDSEVEQMSSLLDLETEVDKWGQAICFMTFLVSFSPFSTSHFSVSQSFIKLSVYFSQCSMTGFSRQPLLAH